MRRARSTLSISKSQEELNNKNKINSSQKPATVTNSAEMLDLKQKQSACECCGYQPVWLVGANGDVIGYNHRLNDNLHGYNSIYEPMGLYF